MMDECLRTGKLKLIHLVFITLFVGFVVSHADSLTHNSSTIIEQGKDVVKDFYRRFSGKEVDLVFILDRSASIPYQGWSSMITFVRSLLEHFSVTGVHTRVAIITFSSHVSMEINDLNEIHTTKCSLMQQIKQRLERKIPSGYTATYQALKKAQSILLSSRRNAKKSVFVLTDGRSNVGPNPVRASLEIRSLRWNSTWNTTAFGPQVEIYAFGIKDAHLPELKSIASQISNHTFFIPDFKTFANLARQLHNDSQPEEWEVAGRNSLCNNICSKHAVCACGTRIGQYQCICNAGYEGDGTACKLCEKGFYKDSLSPGRCNPCPANSTTNYVGSEHIRDCSCHTPYYREFANDPCQLRQCSLLPQIANGFSFHVEGRMTDEIANTGMPCKNSPGDSCHYECKIGYRLTSNPVLVCETNGSWSGVVPECKIVDCKKLSEVGEDVSNGQDTYINGTTIYNSWVEVSCLAGWQPFGDTVRKCNRHGVWSGTRTWCVEAKCKPLSEISGGEILPPKCTETTLNPGKICRYECKSGYHLIGPSKKICGNHGQWNTSAESRCVDVEKPSLRCPADMEVSVGSDGYAVVHWQNEKPSFSDNSGYAKMTYYGLNKSPAQLKIGFHQVEYVVKDRAHNNDSCIQKIKVLKNIVQVLFCPENINITNVESYKVPVSWTDPVFVNKDNVSVQHECTHVNGNKMAIGHHNVLCSPVKNFGSGVRCRFSVTLKRKTCVRPKAPKNGAVSCQESELYLQACSVSCNVKYDFVTIPKDTYVCKPNGEWSPPELWPDCSYEHILGSAAMHGQIDYYYYSGECNMVKQQIAKMFQAKLQDQMRHHCKDMVCHVEDIEVLCDNSTQRRRRRRRDVLPVNIQTVELFHHSKRDANQQRVLTISFKIKMADDNVTTENEQYQLRRKLGTIRMKISQDQTMDIAIDPSTGIGNISVKSHEFDSVEIESNCEKKGMVTIKKVTGKKCLNCPVGFYYVNYTCEKCPVGFYQDTEGQPSCFKCPPSTSTLTIQSKDKSDCRSFCKPGTNSLDGLAPCEECEISTYQDKFNSTSCVKCPVGRVTSKPGATKRSDCSIPCSPGSYNSYTGLQPCTLCPKHTYQPNKGATECYFCPSNSRSNKSGAKSFEDCLYEDHCQTNKTSKPRICLNGGTCHNNFENFTCECADGFTGKVCEVNIDECEGQVCHNGGTCHDAINDFTCKCKAGYTGFLCDQEINECESSPCQNGGSCADRFNKFKCYCPQHYTGKLCETRINLCSPSPCKKRGTCENMSYGYKCHCHTGYAGVNCSVVIDQCISLPCLNGGTCKQVLNTFSCTCPQGYIGDICEKDVDECASDPCLNGGRCVNLRNDYHCLCVGGFGGKNCQNEISADFDLVFHQQTTENYVRLMMFPNPEEISVCFWMRTLDVSSIGTIFSYSRENNQPYTTDTFTLYDYGRLQLFVNGQHLFIDLSLNDGLWHHLCTTWSSVQGEWYIYINGTEAKHGQGLATGFKLPSGGDFLIGQNVDVLFGAAGSTDSFVGEISQFNVYKHVLSEMEIKSLGNHSKCNTAFGNVLAWSQVPLRTHGDVQIRNNSHCMDINECLFPTVFKCGQKKLCNDMVGGYECNKCKYGYSGPKCDEAINECSLGVCLNGAQCKDGPDPYDYTCSCTVNFTGPTCADQLIPCPIPDPCKPISTCVPSKNDYFCKKKGGSTDPGSPTIDCKAMNPCENGGGCESTPGEPDKCVCPPMWKGELCVIFYRPDCDLSPCLNNGTCIEEPDSLLGYRCACPNDYNGRDIPVHYDANCALKNPCDSNPCQNDGYCLKKSNDKFSCDCLAPYHGDFCEMGGSSNQSSDREWLFCDDSMKCYNSGTCQRTKNGFWCQCPLSYSGYYCKTELRQVKKMYKVSVEVEYAYSRANNKSFKARFNNQIKSIFHQTLRNSQLQIDINKLRPGYTFNQTLVEFTLTFIEYLHPEYGKAYTDSYTVKRVIEDSLHNNKLGNLRASHRHFSFEEKEVIITPSAVSIFFYVLVSILILALVVVAIWIYLRKFYPRKENFKIESQVSRSTENGPLKYEVHLLAVRPISRGLNNWNQMQTSNPAYSPNTRRRPPPPIPMEESPYAELSEVVPCQPDSAKMSPKESNLNNQFKMENAATAKIVEEEIPDSFCKISPLSKNWSWFNDEPDKDSKDMPFKLFDGVFNRAYDTEEYMVPYSERSATTTPDKIVGEFSYYEYQPEYLQLNDTGLKSEEPTEHKSVLPKLDDDGPPPSSPPALPPPPPHELRPPAPVPRPRPRSPAQNRMLSNRELPPLPTRKKR